MKRTIIQNSSVKLPQKGRADENEEFGRQSKGVTECPRCKNVLFKKSWHTSFTDLEKRVKQKLLRIRKRELCPACAMERDHLYEGEVIIEKFPERLHEELFNLIYNFGIRAKARDPQDRILTIEKGRRGFRLLTTENQLATRLGKKLKEVFNTVDLTITHSREPDAVERVHVLYLRS